MSSPAAEKATEASRRRGPTRPDGESAVLSDPARAQRLGRLAETPRHIPWSGWKSVLRRTVREMISDRMSLIAAGCAFYATLALFPAMTMLIFIYGLAFDPVTVEPQMSVLREVLPASAFDLIHDRIHTLVSAKQDTLTIGLAISTLITLWSSATGTKSILSALNVAYEETERRGFLRFQLTALGMTTFAMLGVVFAIALLVFLPAVFAFVGLSAHEKTLIGLVGFSILIAFVMLSLSLLYRFGPSRRQARWAWVTPGSAVATLLWVVASALLSFYITNIASYSATYGPLGAVAAVMMWFYVSVYVVLFGAELNSELEMQTVRDSTGGAPRPLGERGAFVADHVAPD